MMVPAALWRVVLVAAIAACSSGTPDSSSQPATTDSGSTAATEAADSSGTHGQSSTEILTPNGWGPLRIGMTLAEVTVALGPDARPDAVGGPDPDRCDEFRPANAPDGMLVMIEDGALTRISISRNSGITTPAGFRVGDAGTAVLAEYGGRAQVKPHQYWAQPAKYITVWQNPLPDADPRGIRYEIDSDDVVAHLRAGGPSIEYVEGCV